MQGRKHTDEARKKITEANLSRITCKRKLHYAFKGSHKISHPIGYAHCRLKKELYDEYVGNNGMKCELCGNIFHNNKIDDGDKVIMHHFVDTRKIIDIIQDVNVEWNTMFVHKICHIRIHLKLRGMNAIIDKDAWLAYVKRHNAAVKKMKELISIKRKQV
jgi:hypothetical protein